MPRRARMYIPGLPYHVVQRGNNREPCFIEPENYLFYLELWKSLSEKYGVDVHAYCLMTNHIHFLVTPNTETSLSTTMKVVGSRYAHYVNRKTKRTGTLWESRHKASPVDAENYLLLCSRYIELNPVKAKMVEFPSDYKWSSYCSNAEGISNRIIESHELYKRLGKTCNERCESYKELFKNKYDCSEDEKINKAVEFSVPTGDGIFKAQIERMLGRKVGQAYRGRPRKIE